MKHLGFIYLYYNIDGSFITGCFNPNSFSVEDINDKLQFVDGTKGEEKMKDNAKTLLSAWFSRQNEIELADREQYEIALETIDYKKWSSGNIRSATISVNFKQRVHEKANEVPG